MCESLSLGELKEHIGENITGIRPKSLKDILDRGIRDVITWNDRDFEQVKVMVNGKMVFSHRGLGKSEYIKASPKRRNMGRFFADQVMHTVVIKDDFRNTLFELSDSDKEICVISEPENRSTGVLEIRVFEDGTIFYCADGKETMFSLRECGEYEYRFSDGTVIPITEEYIYGTDWNICLIMYAEDKLLRNALRHKKEVLWNALCADENNEGISDKNTVMWNCYIKEYFRRKEELDRVGEALEILCEQDRIMFEMYYLAGFSQTEIAGRIGISREHVCRRMNRALNKIQNNLF